MAENLPCASSLILSDHRILQSSDILNIKCQIPEFLAKSLDVISIRQSNDSLISAKESYLDITIPEIVHKPTSPKSPQASSTLSSSATGVLECPKSDQLILFNNLQHSRTASKLDISLKSKPKFWDCDGLLKKAGYSKTYRCCECEHISSYASELVEHYQKMHPDLGWEAELFYCRMMLGAPHLTLNNDNTISHYGPSVNCKFRQMRRMRRWNNPTIPRA